MISPGSPAQDILDVICWRNPPAKLAPPKPKGLFGQRKRIAKPFKAPPFHNPVQDIAYFNDSSPLGKRKYFHYSASALPQSPRGLDWDRPVSWRCGKDGARWDRTNSLPALSRVPKG